MPRQVRWSTRGQPRGRRRSAHGRVGGRWPRAEPSRGCPPVGPGMPGSHGSDPAAAGGVFSSCDRAAVRSSTRASSTVAHRMRQPSGTRASISVWARRTLPASLTARVSPLVAAAMIRGDLLDRSDHHVHGRSLGRATDTGWLSSALSADGAPCWLRRVCTWLSVDLSRLGAFGAWLGAVRVGRRVEHVVAPVGAVPADDEELPVVAADRLRARWMTRSRR